MKTGLVWYPIEPNTKPRMTKRDKFLSADPRTIRPAVAKYSHFRDLCHLHKVELPATGIVRIHFYISLPESWSQKKKDEHEGRAHMKVPDVDNLTKALFDALLTDDSHIWNCWATKRWATTGSIGIDYDFIG